MKVLRSLRPFASVVGMVIACAASVDLACAAAPGAERVMAFPGKSWAEASPESQGIDGTRLGEALAYLERNAGKDGIAQVVVIRNGVLVWKGPSAATRHGIWSATKSFTSTVLGLLIDDGAASLDTLAKDHVAALAPAYPLVTLRHFTTMTSGYYALGDEPRGSYRHGPSPTPFLPRGEPLFSPPGSRYAYWDSAMNEFGLVLTRIARRPLKELFKERIADPIGMDPAGWEWGALGETDGIAVTCGSGNGGKHVVIDALELARLGHLFLNAGAWDGKRLISAAWVAAATSVQVPASAPLEPLSGADGRGVYGFNWWVNGIGPSGARKWPGAPPGTFAASGYNNNDMFVIPEWKMVIVRLGLDQADRAIGDAAYGEFLRLVGAALTDEPKRERSSASAFQASAPNEMRFDPVEARFVRLVILESRGGEPCIDELEVYGPGVAANLALASAGAKASASSLLPGFPIHQIAHLNDGSYGNSRSWIAGSGGAGEWAQIELAGTRLVDRVVFSRDREGRFADRTPARVEVRVSPDGERWTAVARGSGLPDLPEGAAGEEALLRYAFACEDKTWRSVAPGDGVRRVLAQFEVMIERFAAQGIDVSKERAELVLLRAAEKPSFFEARMAKRRLFLRAPDLAGLDRVLFVKRHPYEPSHNYSVIFDAAGPPGGGVCVLEIPRAEGRLEPGRAKLSLLFDARDGVARDPVPSCDAGTIYFSWRSTKQDYFHLYRMRADGSGLTPLSGGPFHDYFPCPLPDGGLAFMSTRCACRFLCWRPQAFVLFRMAASGGSIRPLSHANLSEWTPSLMRDGRILWMRSEYLDKGADFGHTLWAIRPDGAHPELIFGNNTLNCYAGGREVPGTTEIVCTLVSHGGDLNGPIALIDPALGRANARAITSLTPDVAPHYHMSWARERCFRDPFPLSRDYFLCSHAPADTFGLYLIDRYGNRELLYLDPAIGCMGPVPLAPAERSPVIPSGVETTDGRTASPHGDEGVFVLADIYHGLEPFVARGVVRFIRVCEEVRSNLTRLPSGDYQSDHDPFEDWYASPTHKVRGPHGWPSYVAKGDLGLAPVEADGSASFYAPAGKVLYFQALDENLNELQRMRSVVQLQSGERRSCIGCHENRSSAPPSGRRLPLALGREPSRLAAPPWGSGPFSYEKVVQPVWDANCARCHGADHPKGIDLRGVLDRDGVPASYRTLIERGLVHHFDFAWGTEHTKARPLSFGTVRSRLWQVLDGGHHDVKLSGDDRHRVTCWTDLNCPLWPDYVFRPQRPGLQASAR